MPNPPITDELKGWSELSPTAAWESLLIGNGASRAVWDRFSYPSLYDVAQLPEIRDGLASQDLALFDRLGQTRNFEAVLGALLTSRTVADTVGLQPIERLDTRYESIQAALVAAVHHVHVPWRDVPSEILLSIRQSLAEYEFVFSTNYDLLMYWAIMADGSDDFRDYFWGAEFDADDTEIWGSQTKILYLHGALHLFYSADGRTYKERAEQGVSLLDLFGKRSDGVPLCITEGTAQEKLLAIARSDYLTFAHQQLAHTRGPLVVLGQALGETDAHIADVLARQASRQIAIGIYPVNSQQTIRDKAHFVALLPEANLEFFDSRSHPLCDQSLRIG